MTSCSPTGGTPAEPKTDTSHKHDDYEHGVVPAEERKSWLPIAGIWIAVGIDLSGTIMGVQLGAGMPFGEAIWATIIGSVLLGLMAMACTWVGAATGFTSSVLARTVFGRGGGRLISIFMAISSLGWFGVQTGFFADNARIAVHELFHVNAPVWIFIVVGGILMMITALWGYRSIERLSSWAVPLLIALLILAVVMAFAKFGTGKLFDHVTPQFSFGGAVSLIMGIFVLGVIVSPDIARWARTPVHAMIAGFVGFFIGNSLIVVVALVLSRVMGASDLMRMFFALGLGAVAIVVLTLAQWTTNTNNLYGAALNLSVVFSHVSRRTLTLVGGVVAIAAALLGIYDAFIPFISLMGALIAPYGGVYLADYFVNRRGRLHLTDPVIPAVDVWAFISWIVGGLFGLATTQPTDGFGLGLFSFTTIPALDALIVSFAVHAILCAVRRQAARSPMPDAATPAQAGVSTAVEHHQTHEEEK